MIRKTLSILVCLIASPAFAAQSVWDEAKNEAYQITGKVVSIATNEQEILVRISDGRSTETFKVCSAYPGGDSLNMVENERMRSIRDAFNSGKTIKASYNSNFDRCLTSVEIRKDLPPNVITQSDSRKKQGSSL